MMRRTKRSKTTILGTLAVLAAAAACNAPDAAEEKRPATITPDVPPAARDRRALEGKVFEVPASRETLAGTGVKSWIGRPADGATPATLDGLGPGGSLRLRLTFARDANHDTLHVASTVVARDGTSETGALDVGSGKVWRSALPALTTSAVSRFKADYEAFPHPLDYAGCQAAINTEFWAIIEAEAACAAAETPPTIAVCLAAVAAAESDYNNEVAVCDDCPCPEGYQCQSGQCTQYEECIYYGDCGTLTDSCGYTQNLGDNCQAPDSCIDNYCQCISQGCTADMCGYTFDNCGNPIACDFCPPGGACGSELDECINACEGEGLSCDETSCSCY